MNETEYALLPGWSVRIRMLSSARLWKSFLLVFGIPVTLISVVVSFAAGTDQGIIVLLGGWGLFAFLWAAVGVIIDASGGFTAAYAVTNRGVHSSLGRGSRGAADAATLLGVLARSPGAVGAGLLARSEQDAFIAWNDVRRVTISQRSRYVQIRAGFGSKPVGIYCTEENFSPVCDIVRARRAHVAG
jgi:hypothetical protein